MHCGRESATLRRFGVIALAMGLILALVAVVPAAGERVPQRDLSAGESDALAAMVKALTKAERTPFRLNDRVTELGSAKLDLIENEPGLNPALFGGSQCTFRSLFPDLEGIDVELLIALEAEDLGGVADEKEAEKLSERKGEVLDASNKHANDL